MIAYDASTHAYVQRLRTSSAEIVDRQLAAIGAVMPDFGTDQTAPFAHAAAVANLEQLAITLEQRGTTDVAVPAAVDTLVRHLAWAGVEVDVLARAYRIGQDYVYRDIRSFCSETCTTADEAIALLGTLGQSALRFADRSTTLVIERYKRERQELAHHPNVRRAQVVSALLRDDSVDVATCERTLGYALAGAHTAVRINPVSDRAAPARTALLATAATITSVMQDPPALVVEDRPDTLMLWVHTSVTPAHVDALNHRLAGRPVRVCVGDVGRGLSGFRRTAWQADRTNAVGAIYDNPLMTYRQVALTALLLDNPSAARDFMIGELGELAAANEVNETLRQTLRAFLAHQCRFVPTARATFLHRNTVAERIRRIETMLGTPVSARASELDAALRLQRHLSAVDAAGRQ